MSDIRCGKNIMVKAKTDDYDSGGDGITFPVCSTITFAVSYTHLTLPTKRIV